MPEIEQRVEIRECRQYSGGVCPRLILDSVSAAARLTNFLAYASEQAPQSLWGQGIAALRWH